MVEISWEGASSTLYVRGDIDLDAERPLRDALASAIRTPGDVILDLTDVAFMDSTGLNIVIWACRELGPERRLRLRHPARMIQRLLDMTRLVGQRNLVVEDGAEEAGDGHRTSSGDRGEAVDGTPKQG